MQSDPSITLDDLTARWQRDAGFAPAMDGSERDGLVAGWNLAMKRTLNGSQTFSVGLPAVPILAPAIATATAPHEDIVPLTKEVRCGGNRPEERKRHDPHGRHHHIAPVTQSRFRTGPNDRTKEGYTGQKADDPDLAKHLNIIIMWMRMAIVLEQATNNLFTA